MSDTGTSDTGRSGTGRSGTGMSDSSDSTMGGTSTGDTGASDPAPSGTVGSDADLTGAGLRLVLAVPERCGLDEVLVGRVSLVNDGPEPVEVNGRLTLAEGDLAVTVRGPAGDLEAGWPWPADAGPRTAELAPGSALETGVLLLSTSTSAPLFPSAGHYTLVARYDAGCPGAQEVPLTSAPVGVTRTEPTTDPGRSDRRALLDRDVIQSVAAGGTMGAAGPALADLAARGTGTTALLAGLATGSSRPGTGSGGRATGSSGPVTGLLPPTGEAEEAGAVPDPVEAAAALTAVLLPGDERRAELGEALELGRDARAGAMLRAQPTTAPG